MSGAAEVEFVAVHRAANAVSLPDGFSVEDYRGLSQVEVVKATHGEHLLVLRFVSRTAYEASRERLCDALGLEEEIFGAFPSQSRTARKSRRQRLVAAVVGIAAVLGPLEVLHNHYQSVLGYPRFSVSAAPGAARVDVLDGVPGELRFAGVNTTPYPPNYLQLFAVDAWLEDETGRRKDGAAVIAESTKVSPRIAMGQLHEVVVEVSPELAGGRSQTCVVEIEGKAGWLFPCISSTARCTVTVWPNAAVVSETLDLVEAHPTYAVFEGTVRCGRAQPKGVSCRAVLQDATLAYPSQVFPDSHHSVTPGESDPRVPGLRTASLAWKTSALGAFEKAPFRLVVSARDGAQVDWQELSKQLKVESWL